jgi:hypothetical protein
MSEDHIKERINAYEKWLTAYREAASYSPSGMPLSEDDKKRLHVTQDYVDGLRKKANDLEANYKKLEDSDRKEFRKNFDVPDNDEWTYQFLDHGFNHNLNKYILDKAEDNIRNQKAAENNADSIKIPNDFMNQKKVLSEFNKLNLSDKKVFLDKYGDKLLDEADKGDAKIDMKTSGIWNALFDAYESSVEHSSTVDDVYCALFEDDDYLAHHGILGMKWGIRRFQNPDGTRTAAGKARYNEGGPVNPIKKIGDAMKQRKTDKQRKAALEKARQAKAAKAAEAKAKEEHEAGKQKALESGDYKEIQKYAHEVSTKELQDALMRADTLDRLNKSVEAHTPKQKDVWDTIDDVAKKVGTATNAFNKGKDAWNSFANAWNTFADNDSMLPELGTNFAEQKEKKRKERIESERKDKVDMLSKTLDPKKIMDNQDIFTKNELSEALGRIATYNSLKEEQSNRNTAGEKAIKEAEARAIEQLEKKRKDKVDKLIKGGDFSKILKNKDLFTNDELKSVTTRYENIKSISDYLNPPKTEMKMETRTEGNTSAPKPTVTKSNDWYDTYDFPDDDNGSTYKAKKAVTDVFAYLNSNTDPRYSAPPAWQSILQSTLDEYE